MSECLPDLPRYIRQRGNEWQGADHQNGPWRSIPAPQSGLPWPVPPATEESSAPQPAPATLSPAAQAVMDAFLEVPMMLNDQLERIALAAALRAVADQAGSAKHWHVDQLRAIAAELEEADG